MREQTFPVPTPTPTPTGDRHVARAAAAWAAIAATAAATACARPDPPPTDADRALAARVTGVWDAELLRDPGSGGAFDDRPPGVRARALGALTLLATRRTIHGIGRGLPRPPLLTGVFDLPGAALGFVTPGQGTVAELAAAVTAPDSLVAVLPADGDDPALVLSGTVDGDTVRGTWTYTGRSLPTWRGTFVLSRRRPSAVVGAPDRASPRR